MKALYALTPDEHATVLAALRLYAEAPPECGWPHYRVRDIATNGGTVTPLDAAAVGRLTDDLNNHGLEFGEVVNLLGVDSSNPYAAFAHSHRLLSEGVLEVDETAVLNEAGDGAYVMAWLWVSNEDAGVTPEEA